MPDDFNQPQNPTTPQTASSIAGGAASALDQARESAGDMLESARERARTLEEDCEEYIRKNPTTAILAALAGGFVIGLLIRK